MKAHLQAIDGLRGIFAVLVMVYHCSYWLQLPFSDWIMSTLRIWGIYGVEGFFVISGIALSVSTKPSQFKTFSGIRTFLLRRYSRILPLYMLMFTVYTRHFPVKFELLMLFGFYNPAKSALVGGWSIGVEFVFYFLFPFIVLLCINNIYRATLLFFSAIALLAWYSAGFDLGAKLATQNDLYVHPVNHFLFFAGGYFLGVIYQHRSSLFSGILKQYYLYGFCVAFFILISAYGADHSDQIELMVGYKRIVLAVLVITLVGGVMYLHVAGWLPVFLGDISYAVYLIHPVIVFKVLPFIPLGNPWAKLALVMGVSVPLAYLSHRYFEMPAQSYIRKVMNA